jgi:hypothetical protein
MAVSPQTKAANEKMARQKKLARPALSVLGAPMMKAMKKDSNEK